MIEQDKMDFIMAKIAKRFHCFGQGSFKTPYTQSPISDAMSDKPLAFALGVDVEEVVNFVRQWDAYLANY